MAAGLLVSLQQILYRLVDAANHDARQALANEPEKPGRFPVTVRPETRAFLDAYAHRWGGSVAGVAGAILDGVAMEQMRGGEAAMRGTAERLALLIEEHQLSYPAAAEMLSDLGLTLDDLSAAEVLRGKLTSPRLQQIAARFHVNYDWLVGKSEVLAVPQTQMWYKAVDKAASLLLEAKDSCERVRLIVATTSDANLDMKDEEGVSFRDAPHFFPVLRRENCLPGGEKFATYEIWEEGRWSYWRSRHHLKLVVYFAELAKIDVIGKRLSSQEYNDVLNGRVLPSSVFNRHHVTWHPDDYVPFRGQAPTLDKDEWNVIAKSDDNAWIDRCFNKLLSRETSSLQQWRS